MSLKNGVIGFLSGFIALVISNMGGWSIPIQVFFIVICLDYASGLIVAGYFKNSQKTETGGLLSSVGIAGIIKKIMLIVYIIVAYQIDLLLGVDYVANGVTIAFIVNDIISLMENGGLMGIKIPPVIKNSLDLLTKLEEGGKL